MAHNMNMEQLQELFVSIFSNENKIIILDNKKLDIASGNSVDWTYDVANVLFSYAVELRDKGEYGRLYIKIIFRFNIFIFLIIIRIFTSCKSNYPIWCRDI
jgi:hypothetical protein